MKLSLAAERSTWLELPSSFPTERGELPREWEDRVIAGMREAWRGAMTPPLESVVREALRHGLSRVSEDDSVTLQYWPTASIVNAIVHITAETCDEDSVTMGLPLDDIDYAVEPATDIFEAPFLGEGIEARYLTPVASEPPIVLGGLAYLFEGSTGRVAVAVEPTMPQIIGIMLEPLREVVRSLKVIDDDGEWRRSTVDESVLVGRGETWPLYPEPVVSVSGDPRP